MSTTSAQISGRFTLGVACGILACAASAQPQAPAAERTLFRTIYQKQVEINTTDSVGDNTQAARAMATRLKAGEGIGGRSVEEPPLKNLEPTVELE